MNTLEFTIKLIDVISWPLITIFIIIILRRPLIELLYALKQFRYKNIHLDFNQEIERIRKESEEFLPSQDTDLKFTVSDVKKLAQNPKLTIDDAWQDLESEIIELAKNKGLRIYLLEGQLYPLRSLVKGLAEEGYITPNIEGTFNALRQFRNTLHINPSTELTLESAVSFAQMVYQLIEQLKNAKNSN